MPFERGLIKEKPSLIKKYNDILLCESNIKAYDHMDTLLGSFSRLWKGPLMLKLHLLGVNPPVALK